jgi:hypothetical protein
MSSASAAVLLRSLKLPGFLRSYAEVAAAQAEREGWGFERYLLHLAEIEIEDRRATASSGFSGRAVCPTTRRCPPSSFRACRPPYAGACRPSVKAVSSIAPRICSPLVCRDASNVFQIRGLAGPGVEGMRSFEGR